MVAVGHGGEAHVRRAGLDNRLLLETMVGTVCRLCNDEAVKEDKNRIRRILNLRCQESKRVGWLEEGERSLVGQAIWRKYSNMINMRKYSNMRPSE
jgi:hypothetical protein